jgi:hypothetical protein
VDETLQIVPMGKKITDNWSVRGNLQNRATASCGTCL